MATNKPANVSSKIWAALGDVETPTDAKMETGWVAEVPKAQVENWVQNRQDAFNAHVNERGIAEWDATTDYIANKSYVQDSSGTVYRAVQNTGPTTVVQNPTTDGTNTYWTVAFAGGSLDVYTKGQADARFVKNLDLPGASAIPSRLDELEQFSEDLTDTTNMSKGAAQVGRAVVSVASIVDMLGAKQDVSQTVIVGAYHPGQFALANFGEALGGGAFRWAPAVPRTGHNGGTIISPTVPWGGSQSSLADFLAGEGELEPSGLGCWIRVCDEIRAVDFGVVNDRDVDSSPAFGAALRYAAKINSELVLPDFIFGVHSTVVIDGAETLFSTVKMRGSFCSSATALGYIPDRCGTVIYTKGNCAIEMWFNDFRNENYAIRGVGFCDQSFYPPGSANSGAPAIRLMKGTLTGENIRYITGNVIEDVAFVGFGNAINMVGVVPASVEHSVDKNYIGPTTFNRVNATSCGSAVLLTDCTMNHFWWNNSTLFGLTGYGVQVIKTPEGSGGNVCVTYNNMVFEAMLGMINTAGANLPGVGVGIRNKLVLNSCNHEYCGAFGPGGEYGIYSGNPLGYTGYTDVYINGIWTKELGFGESTLPMIDAGGQIFATTDATVAASSDGIIRTPNTINSYRKTVNYADGESKATLITLGGAGGFVVELDIEIADGALGFQRAIVRGQIGVSGVVNIVGTVEPSVTVSVTVPAAAGHISVSVANASGFPFSVKLSATSPSGIEMF
jgi:hypothetical protein